ncbi:MAG: 16S rRNA (guanine(527)-N(7))-methyltransferase RsmG [Acidimicrobiales bacterium]
MVQALGRAKELGFLGPGPLWLQVSHSQGFARCLEELTGIGTSTEDPGALQPATFLDLGSGGGVPGLVLAGAWCSSRAVLLDSSLRRTRFLEEVVRDLRWLGRVEAIRARAEVAGRADRLRSSFDLVVARGFASPAVTAECAAPFLKQDGLLIVSEPPSSEGELRQTGDLEAGSREASDPKRWPAEGLGRLGLEPLCVFRGDFGYEVLRQVAPCPERFPRREGIPRKRPLYR